MGSQRLLTEDETLVASDTETDLSDVQDHDRDILMEVDHDDRRGWRRPFARHNATSRSRRKRRRRSQAEEETEVMFEMEGGFKDTSSQSSQDDTIARWANEKTKPRSRRLYAFIIPVLALLGALTFGVFRASKSPTRTYFNGTSIFRPTTILISLDGFRADFVNRNITPALDAFISSGVSPQYMLPSFPSLTFPNHFTLVTGLYPESHGIVGNQFWDPKFQEEFYYTDTKVSMQSKWWNAEPLWVTAEHQGLRSAIHMWPGSEAHIPDVEPTYLDKFKQTEALTRKVDRILHWLDLPGDNDGGEGERRPQFIAAYVPDVDADGHLYGPNSTEIRSTIADVDSMLTLLTEGLFARNLTEIVNLIVLSDHGMATTSNSRLIQLDDLIDLSLVDHIDGWPLRGLRLKNPDRDVPILYEQLSAAAAELGSFDVYTLETMPKRYHFTNNDRIAPLWIIPRTGWAVVEKAEFDMAQAQTTGEEYHPKGLHGYDHEHPLMRAIFVARGPSFPHTPNSRVANFQNIEVYNILCDSLGIKPHPNNGTLRLPLKPIGLHGPDNGGLPSPPDPPINPDPPKDLPSESHPEDIESTGKPGWWDYIHSQLSKAKEWAKAFLKSLKGNNGETKAS